MKSLRPRSSRLALAAGALLLMPLAACGTVSSQTEEGEADTPSEAGDAFEPVTIEHAFGETEITAKPERVVALGWGSGDAAIALGTTPVALDVQTYGANPSGLMPWVEDAVEEAGDELPATLQTGEAPDFQAIDEADPDVILANYSGITEADYGKLEQIAPTVAYPDQPWSTPWRDVVTTVGEVLGESDQAQELLSDLDAQVSEAAAEHPEFEGKTIAAVAIDPSAFYVYTGADPRVEFLEDLGFEVAPSVAELDESDESSFFYTLSTERVDELTSDVLLSYNSDEAAQTAVADDPTYQAMEQFRDDRVADVTGESVVSSVSPPTVLSLPFSLDDFVDALAAAVPQG